MCGYFFRHDKFIDDGLRRERTDSSSEAVGHHHKEALSRGTLCFFGLLIYVQSTGDIKEVKGEAIDDTTKDKENNSRHTRISGSEETKAEYPGEHRHKHDVLDTKSLKEEWNGENTERLTYLADRD